MQLTRKAAWSCGLPSRSRGYRGEGKRGEGVSVENRDERNIEVRAVEIERMHAESARFNADAAWRNAETTRLAEEHEVNIAKREREEEEAVEDRNIERTNAIQAKTMWLVEFAKKDTIEAEKQAYWEITGKGRTFLLFVTLIINVIHE